MKKHFTGKNIVAPRGKVTSPSLLTISFAASPLHSIKPTTQYFLIGNKFKETEFGTS